MFPNRIGRLSARAASVFFGCFAVFQVGLALGAPLGEMAWGGGSSAVLSQSLRISSGIAAFYLAGAAAVMLVRSEDIGRTLPPVPFRWINGLLMVQMALNTAGNLASSTPMERFGMGSASLVGFGLCAISLFADKPKGPIA